MANKESMAKVEALDKTRYGKIAHCLIEIAMLLTLEEIDKMEVEKIGKEKN